MQEIHFRDRSGVMDQPSPPIPHLAGVILVQHGEALVGAWGSDGGGFIHPDNQLELSDPAMKAVVAEHPNIDLTSDVLRVFTCPEWLVAQFGFGAWQGGWLERRSRQPQLGATGIESIVTRTLSHELPNEWNAAETELAAAAGAIESSDSVEAYQQAMQSFLSVCRRLLSDERVQYGPQVAIHVAGVLNECSTDPELWNWLADVAASCSERDDDALASAFCIEVFTPVAEGAYGEDALRLLLAFLPDSRLAWAAFGGFEDAEGDAFPENVLERYEEFLKLRHPGDQARVDEGLARVRAWIEQYSGGAMRMR